MRWITSCQQFNSKLRRLQHVNLIALHHNDRCCADQWPIPRPGSSLFLVWRRRLKKQRSLVAAWRHQRPIVSRVFRQNRGLAKTKFCMFTSTSFIHDSNSFQVIVNTTKNILLSPGDNDLLCVGRLRRRVSGPGHRWSAGHQPGHGPGHGPRCSVVSSGHQWS